MQLDFVPLNAIGAAIYLLVAATCMFAWLHIRGGRETGRGWAVVLVFFVCLAVSRLMGLEDIIRELLRTVLRERGSYDHRQAVQISALAGLGMITLLSVFGFKRSTSFNLRSLRSSPLTVAYLACATMTALIIVRIVSLHAVDALLYGTLKLNWAVDLGCTAAVAGSALWAIKAARQD